MPRITERTINLPNGKVIDVPWFIPTETTYKEQQRILSSQYFLVRMAGGPIGEIWKCRGCGSKHRYLTLRCVEQPFNGLSGGLYAYWHVIGAASAAGYLTESELKRYESIGGMFVEEEFSKYHPRTARELKVEENDMDKCAMALGILEPITKEKAQKLADTINSRRVFPRFTLPGLE